MIKDPVKRSFYFRYYNIIRRCNNKNYHNYPYYGGRGIKCLWDSMAAFRNDMYDSFVDAVARYGLKNVELDRINNEGNYCKENCRWVTPKMNARNKRKTRYLTYKGATKPLSEWAEIIGINNRTLATRIFILGWGIDKSFYTPTRKIGRGV